MTGLLTDLSVLVIAVPLLAAAAMLATGPWLPRVAADGVSVAVSALTLVAATWIAVDLGGGRAVTWVGGWLPDDGGLVGIALVADRLAAGFTVVSAGVTTMALAYSWRYLEDVSATYHGLMLVFLASMNGFALAGDLFNAFVWFELMGVAAYALTGLRIEEPRSVQGALVFGIVNTLGASLSLLGVSLLYARTGELNLARVGEELSTEPVDALVTMSFVLLISGVLVKASAVPFHFWTADAEAVAPTPVCAMISGAMVALGVYATARWWWVVFVDVIDPQSMHHLLLGLGIATSVVGAVMCVGQRHIKRLLAYSTISHVGLFLVGVALLSEHGVAATALYVAGHACVKGALFLGTGVLLNRFHTVDEHALFGRCVRMRLTAGVFAVGGLALAGLPPLGVWLGKSLLEHAAVLAHASWLAGLVVLCSVLTGGAVLRVTARVFFGLGTDPRVSGEPVATEEPETEPETPHRTTPMLLPAWVLLAVSILVGTTSAVHVGTATAAAAFVDTTAYRLEVLHPSQQMAAAVGSSSPTWTVASVGLGLLSACLALAVASCALWGRRLPLSMRLVTTPARRVQHALHRVHEGHLGDHVSWMMLGVAAIAIAMS